MLVTRPLGGASVYYWSTASPVYIFIYCSFGTRQRSCLPNWYPLEVMFAQLISARGRVCILVINFCSCLSHKLLKIHFWNWAFQWACGDVTHQSQSTYCVCIYDVIINIIANTILSFFSFLSPAFELALINYCSTWRWWRHDQLDCFCEFRFFKLQTTFECLL